MKSYCLPAAVVSLLFGLDLPAQDPVLSEFMALNAKTIQDRDREFSDWVEVYNPHVTPISLAGWALTDNRESAAKWVFPDVTLQGGQFLVVFASGKDRRTVGQELHTNFQILGGGEYLALVDPTGRRVREYTPRYPRQVSDASFGAPMELTRRALFAEGATARWFVPTNSSLGSAWNKTDFDDAAWQSGPTGLGFDQKAPPTYQDLIKTDVGAMYNTASSIYIRIAFNAAEADVGRLIQLRAKYDDGFIAYLNGVEVARRNLSGTSIRYDAKAAAERTDGESRTFQSVPLPAASNAIVAGTNILAIQALNNARNGNDFLFVPELEVVEVASVDANGGGYFALPTPGWPNDEALPGVASDPVFSELSRAFTGSLSLELLALNEGEEVRYTLDGTEPSIGAQLYSTPIELTTTKNVKAKTFKSGLLPSGTITHSYIALNANVVNFNSNLPLFIISTFGKNIATGTYTQGQLMVIDRGDDGRARITDETQFAGIAAFKIRGSSTAGQPKSNWTMEVRDDQGDDRAVSLLGLPEDSDWILHAPYSFDLALMRNPFIFELSNQVGRYATRGRMIEVYYNPTNGPLAQNHYYGVYNFMEKIKQGEDRVNVEELPPEATTEPDIAGGWMLKIDRLGPGESGFSAAGQGLVYVYPEEREVPTHQKTWIRNYFNAFGAALNGSKFTDPELGYRKYVDVDSWIDHHLLNNLAKNVDALRLSTYFFKSRFGKIEFGPIWDFDRSMDSTDGRDDDPRTWNGTGDGTPMFTYPWWGRLFSDPAFMARYQERWLELRGGPFSTANMHAIIDGMAEELKEAQARNFQRWTVSTAAAFPNEVNKLKNWLAARATWIDSQYIQSPKLSHPGGVVDEGFKVSITEPSGELFITLNGPDPMAADGNAAPEAVPYTGPIEIKETTRIRARTRIAARVWSPLVQGTYVLKLLPLVVTELMYNPAPPPGNNPNATEFEFIEIQNIGDQPLDLKGVRLGDRPAFDFTGSAVTTLGPGELAVIAKNPDVFATRYGNEIKVAGRFAGTSSFNNRTQTVNLIGPLDEVLLSFTYQSSWHPATNGQGYSLVMDDPQGDRSNWNDGPSWRASFELNGSPGRVDQQPARQVPGDLNQDRRVTISDAAGLVRHLVGGGLALPCASEDGNDKLLDLNGDTRLDFSDAIFLLHFLFLAEAPPAMGRDCVPIAGCPDACAAGG